MQRINVRKGALAVAVAAVAGVAAALAAAPAHAAPAAPATADTGATSTVAAPSSMAGGARLQAGGASSYWTAERMRNAIPAEAPADAKSNTSVRQATGAPGTTPAVAANRALAQMPA